MTESFESARPIQPGRTLPHSLEAEEYLLSSIMLDGADVLAKCAEAGVDRGCFYEAAHGIVFVTCESIHRRGLVPDVSVVAEELKTAKELDAVGGYARLIEISSRIPTTAQASYFIKVVRDQATLRAIIRSGTGIVEDCYGWSGGDIRELVAKAGANLLETAPPDESGDELAFDVAKPVAKPPPILSIGGVTIATAGNLVALYSVPKVGKSSFVAAMMAAAMVEPAKGVDCLGVTGPNYDGKAVLHFDTEQSPYHWDKLVRSSLARAGCQCPPWLRSYRIAGMEGPAAERFVLKAIKKAAKQFNGVHAVYLDGIADLVNDPNSPDECFPLLARLHAAAIEHHTAIICVLHLNPSSQKDKIDKGRGHLGSQLERKAESNLTLKKDGDITHVTAGGRQRGAPVPPDKCPAFRWDDHLMMHVTCARPDESPRHPGGRPSGHRIDDYRELFPKKSDPGMRLGELVRRFSVNKPITPNRLHELLDRWVREGTIEAIPSDTGRRFRLAV